MTENKKYYEVLGLEEGASQIKIKNKFRFLSLIYHPDINKETGSKEKMEEIIEANDALFNKELYEELMKEIKKDTLKIYQLRAKYPFAFAGERLPRMRNGTAINTNSRKNTSYDYDFSKHDFPQSVLENASILYKHAINNEDINYKAPQEIAAACLYIACMQCKDPRMLNEIAMETGLRARPLSRTIHLIRETLNIELEISSIDYIPRFAEKLNLSDETKNRAINILETAFGDKINSCGGAVKYAAASLYFASSLTGENISELDVVDAIGISEVRLLNACYDLTRRLEEQIQ